MKQNSEAINCKKIPTLEETILFNNCNYKVSWKNIITLRYLSNDKILCREAYKNYVECILRLVKKKKLSHHKKNNFSVYRKIGGFMERLDPAFDGSFYSFCNHDDALTYLDELNTKNNKKFYIKEWGNYEQKQKNSPLGFL